MGFLGKVGESGRPFSRESYDQFEGCDAKVASSSETLKKDAKNVAAINPHSSLLFPPL